MFEQLWQSLFHLARLILETGRDSSATGGDLAALLETSQLRWDELSRGADGFGEEARARVLRKVWCEQELVQLRMGAQRIAQLTEGDSSSTGSSSTAHHLVPQLHTLVQKTPVCGEMLRPQHRPCEGMTGVGRKLLLELRRLERMTPTTDLHELASGKSSPADRSELWAKMTHLATAASAALKVLEHAEPSAVNRLEQLLRAPQPIGRRRSHEGKPALLAEQLTTFVRL